jgi:hypothetical protein
MNIEIKGEEVFVDGERYVREPKSAISETDKGRLFWATVLVKDVGGDDTIWEEMKDIEPVHRRWDELSMSKKDEFNDYVTSYAIGRYWTADIFRKAYELITGENHP